MAKMVAKWTNWKFRTRLERIRQAQKNLTRYGAKINLRTIVSGAETVFRYYAKRQGTFIFIGQGMRPLFETVRAINEIEGQPIPRRRLRYIVTPVSIERGGANFSRGERLDLIKEKLARIVSNKNPGNYIIIDYIFGRYIPNWKNTVTSVGNAIREINPKATVTFIQDMQDPLLSARERNKVYKAINYCESMGRPTNKSKDGKTITGKPLEPFETSSNEPDFARNYYLAFQSALLAYVRRRATRKNYSN